MARRDPEFWPGHDGELESADDYPYWLSYGARPTERVSGEFGGPRDLTDARTARTPIRFRNTPTRKHARLAEHWSSVRRRFRNGEEASPAKGTGSSAP